MNREDRRLARFALGRDALLTVAQAAELMPWGDSRCRAWIRSHGLARWDPELGYAVVWGDILDAFGRVQDPPEEVRPASGYPRAGLDRRPLRSRRKEEG